MPRTPRRDFPGAFHHVYARGIEKTPIFSDDCDRQELWRRIQYNLLRFDAMCLAWAFMPNHFHLLFHSLTGSLRDFMRCLMSGYAMYFNRRTGRVGHLFQNRYKSSVIGSERYLFELIRYIHLNPVRSGVVRSVEDLAGYRWTGHRAIVRGRQIPWEGLPFVRDFFAAGEQDGGIARYVDFVAAGSKSRPMVDFSDGELATKGISTVSDHEMPAPDLPDDQRAVFAAVVGDACRRRGIPAHRLPGARRSRIVTELRRDILEACVLDHGLSRRAVSAWLGMTDAGGAYLLKRARSETVGPKEGRGEKFKNVPEL
ncbi:MAG: transposase [Gemmatimonadota bacterium]